MIAITIDCEQWNLPLLEGHIIPENNNTSFSKKGNKKILKILKDFDLKATFFVTGYFAEREPSNLKKIFSYGHEIASHGYNHFYRNARGLNMEDDIKKSKEILESILKTKILGFRSPQAQYSMMLLKILNKLGFSYDSSLHPAIVPGYYINVKYPITPYMPLRKSKLKEIPITPMPYLRFPISWVWMRNLGAKLTEIGVNMLLRKKITPVIYVHSWEFTEVRSKAVPFYIIRNTGKKFIDTFKTFLEDFNKEEFITLSNV